MKRTSVVVGIDSNERIELAVNAKIGQRCRLIALYKNAILISCPPGPWDLQKI